MKKFIIFSLIALVVTALHANGACLLQDLKKEQNCTGGASGIEKKKKKVNRQNNFETKEELQKMYQIPTMATPMQYKFGFPVLNQNCMFGMCFPK